MSIEYTGITREGLSKQIADAIRTAIIDGRLMVDERLPSEIELADRFGVSRPRSEVAGRSASICERRSGRTGFTR